MKLSMKVSLTAALLVVLTQCTYAGLKRTDLTQWEVKNLELENGKRAPRLPIVFEIEVPVKTLHPLGWQEVQAIHPIYLGLMTETQYLIWIQPWEILVSDWKSTRAQAVRLSTPTLQEVDEPEVQSLNQIERSDWESRYHSRFAVLDMPDERLYRKDFVVGDRVIKWEGSYRKRFLTNEKRANAYQEEDDKIIRRIMHSIYLIE